MNEASFCDICTSRRIYLTANHPLLLGTYDKEHLNCRDNYRGYTLLHIAIEEQNRNLFSLVTNQIGINFNVADTYCRTPLHLAIEKKEFAFALELMELGCDIHRQDKAGSTPLMYAVRSCNVIIAHDLLKRGAEINKQDKAGYTALHHSWWWPDINMLDLLIYYGADPRIRNNKDQTFFMSLLRAPFCLPNDENVRRLQVLAQERMIEFEADMNEINTDGISTLFLAITYETPLLEEIIKRGADVNYFHKDLNALHLALQTSNTKAFELIWGTFDYQRVYASEESTTGRPLLCDFFHDYRREDWFNCFSQVCFTEEVVQHAVLHYSAYYYLPPLITEVVKSFLKRGFTKTDLCNCVYQLLAYGAEIFLKDIETISIYCSGNYGILNILLHMDIQPIGAFQYLSHHYVARRVSKDVQFVLDQFTFPSSITGLAEQLTFMPGLFQYCTPTETLMVKLNMVCDVVVAALEHQNDLLMTTDFHRKVARAYEILTETLKTRISFLPTLVELSRNVSRKIICLRYKTGIYPEYKRLLHSAKLPNEIKNILLFKLPVNNNLSIELPKINIIFPPLIENRNYFL